MRLDKVSYERSRNVDKIKKKKKNRIPDAGNQESTPFLCVTLFTRFERRKNDENEEFPLTSSFESKKTFGIPRRRGSGNRCKECGGLDAYRSNSGRIKKAKEDERGAITRVRQSDKGRTAVCLSVYGGGYRQPTNLSLNFAQPRFSFFSFRFPSNETLPDRSNRAD